MKAGAERRYDMTKDMNARSPVKAFHTLPGLQARFQKVADTQNEEFDFLKMRALISKLLPVYHGPDP